MKMKITVVIPIFMAVIVCFNNNTWGQGGLENFQNFPETTSSYEDGTFIGQDGSEWRYINARGDAYANIEAPNPGLNSDPSAMIESGTLTGGIDEFEFDYMQMFSTDVELKVYINDDSVTTVTSDGQKNEVLSSGTIEIEGIDGEFTLRFQNTSSGGQVAIDNIDWFVDTGEPNFLVDPAVLDFSSLKGEGASETKSFELTVLNLDGTDVTVATSANFEVSEDSITYSNEVKLLNYENDTIRVYVRLAEGLELGDYTDYITVSGGGAVDDTVAVTGKIVELFDIPYVNDFRSQENVDIANVQGFNIENAAIQETSDPYLKIYPNGYMETPPIDFTRNDSLGVKFDATTWGGDDGQELCVLVSDDKGASYDSLQFYTITGDYVTHEYVIDLTDTYDVSDGKIKIQMTAGGNSTRFCNFSIENLDATIEPVAAEFDLDAPEDVSTKINWNDASSVQAITVNGTALTEGSGEDYEVSANELIINQSYLDGQFNAGNESVTLTISFDAGSDATFNIISTAAPTYTVSYNANDTNTNGKVTVDDSSYVEGATITVLGHSDLALPGHRFTGWNTQSDGSGESYEEGASFTMGAEGDTLYAVWEAIPYTVTYDANSEHATGEVPIDENDYTIGNEATILGQNTLALEGYAFTGWNTQSDGSGASYEKGASFTMGAEDDTLYAMWEAIPYTLTYDANSENATGDVPIDENDYTIGNEATILGQNTLSLEGYVFSGWNTQSDGSGDSYQEGASFTMGAGDDTLYAMWQIEVYNVIFTVTDEADVAINGAEIFIDNRSITTDGSGQVSIDLAYGDYNYDIIAAGFQDLTGSLTVVGSDLKEAVTMIEELYELSLTVNPDEGGTVSGDGEYEQGDAITLTATAESGYEFINWINREANEVSAESKFDYIMPAKDVSIKANFEKKATSIVPALPESFEIYPNPMQNEFCIETENIDGYVKIYSINGELIIKKQIDADRIYFDISRQPEGLFFIEINSNGNSTTRKLIKN